MSDPAIFALLAGEIEKRLPVFSRSEADPEAIRRALHSLKGSAAVAGERRLEGALARLERRHATGDPDVPAQAAVLLESARASLSAGEPPPLPDWPDPPADLEALASAGREARPEPYASEMRERLLRIDAALAAEGDEQNAVREASREVHAIKGAALAMGDEVTAWFCHGLEERLRAGRTEAQAREVLEELAHFRGILSELLLHPETALGTLRRLAAASRPSRGPSEPAPVSITEPPEAPEEPAPGSAIEAAGLRVPAAMLERLFERVRGLGEVRQSLDHRAGEVAALAERGRALRAGLADALGLIGPPRPWGAPAAAISKIEAASRELAAISSELEAHSARLARSAERVRAAMAGADAELAEMRTAPVASLFVRVSAAAQAQAKRSGLEVRFSIAGGETPVDRRISEALYDPLLQLAQNAVAHGIEPAAERAMRGKSRVGSLLLSAERRGGELSVRVEDDGRGVDVAELRSRAVATGALSLETARHADDEALLGMLFVPGFTTRDRADEVAGRGVGLDLVREGVRRLGGHVRLSNRPGAGVTATIDVPVDRAFARVLWVRCGHRAFAIPVDHVARIELSAPGPPPLRALLGARSPGPPGPLALGLAVTPSGPPVLWASVDTASELEDVTLRAVPSMVRAAGPYLGVVVRGDTLRLCIDPRALIG